MRSLYSFDQYEIADLKHAVRYYLSQLIQAKSEGLQVDKYALETYQNLLGKLDEASS